jgi:peptidase E
MPTKYTLHGGFASHINEQNDSFFKEILKDTPSTLTVLLVLFAKDTDEITASKDKDIAQFERNKESKTITYEVADEHILIEQISRANVIFIHGGNTLQLLEVLRNFENLRELFTGKIIAGTSAGAYVLSTAFYSKSSGGLHKGLGLVPVQTICHYVGENADKLPNDLGLETLLLKDYEYKVFNI